MNGPRSSISTTRCKRASRAHAGALPIRGAAAVAGVAALLGGCMSQFTAGPQIGAKPTQVTVEVRSCDTRSDLFNCKTMPAVALFVGDYLRLNGIDTLNGLGPSTPNAGAATTAALIRGSAARAVADVRGTPRLLPLLAIS